MITALTHTLFPAAFTLASALVCQPVAAPPVDMEFTNAAPLLRNDLTSHELGKYHVSTTFSHSQNETFSTGGLTLSEFGPQYLLNFETATDPDSGQVCLTVKSVKIKVEYAPTVYIASEFHPGTCRYDSTVQHEVRHVDTDVITFNELLPVLKQSVQAAAGQLGVAGPLAPDGIIPARDSMVEKIKQALTAKTDQIEHIRAARQQTIDTRQEYMRMTALCPDEPIPRP